MKYLVGTCTVQIPTPNTFDDLLLYTSSITFSIGLSGLIPVFHLFWTTVIRFWQEKINLYPGVSQIANSELINLLCHLDEILLNLLIFDI